MLPSFATWFTVFRTVFVYALRPFLPMWVLFSASMGISMGKRPKSIKWPKITFPGSKMAPKVSNWGFRGVFVLKSALRILIWAPKVPFSVPPKTPKMGHFGFFRGNENGTWGA